MAFLRRRRRHHRLHPCPSPGGNDYEQALQQNEVAWLPNTGSAPLITSAAARNCAAVATSRAGHRSPIAGPAGQPRRQDREQV
jgi:hypothetical protein